MTETNRLTRVTCGAGCHARGTISKVRLRQRREGQVWHGGTIADLLDDNDFSGSCVFDERIDYDDGLFVGLMDVRVDCGDEGSSFLVISSRPSDDDFITLVQIVIVNDADWDAADQVIRTFNVFDPQAP